MIAFKILLVLGIVVVVLVVVSEVIVPLLEGRRIFPSLRNTREKQLSERLSAQKQKTHERKIIDKINEEIKKRK